MTSAKKRVKPGRDEKVLTDWNGLMLRAFAEARRRSRTRRLPQGCRRECRVHLEYALGRTRLLHSFKDGRARFNGYLDDYANFADGLFALYELTFDYKWLEAAVRVSDRMIEQFWDAEKRRVLLHRQRSRVFADAHQGLL
jgi:uncharacterized protein YyaL (SSP411 family)